jgi:hypothetical protein
MDKLIEKTKKVEFKAILKKVDLFSETLHLIVFPKGSLTMYGKLYNFKEGKKIKITISELND